MTEEIKDWIKYMKEHPDSWKKIHTKFINAQFSKADSFIKKLAEQPGGKEKIIKTYKIKNLKGYQNLFNLSKPKIP